ncbi:MAG: protein kinase [Proteobacteria bacterium]|nr:protein kinase [Pseudomonadota bacterium]
MDRSPQATAIIDPLRSLRASPGAIADLAFADLFGTGASTDGSLSRLSQAALALDLSDPEQRRLGDYELLELIGEGGMGVVYRARQLSLDRDVAVKLLAAGPWASREFVQRFVNEAQNAARMQHPNIVTIFEVGSAEELHFFSMRLINGESLSNMVKREGKLAPQRAAALLRTIAEAVDYAHRLGVLHLDLKPANVLIDENGNPHVADFGLARKLEQGLAADNHEVSGTPSYMAPEQATAGAQRITQATDIWGLGAIGYELVTGEPPFLADTPQATLKLVVAGELRNPRELEAALPPDLAAIIEKCMARDTTMRYASARELAEDLVRFQNGYMVRARPLNTLQRSARWARREPKIVATALFALLALLIGLAATTMQWRRANANAQHAARETLLAENTAAISTQRLWEGRRDAAMRLMGDGQGFAALTPLVANIAEKQAAGKSAQAAVERREVGMIEHQGVTLIDRIIIPEANPMTTALSPDGKLLAVALDDLSVRWYDTATLTERGRVDLLNSLNPDQVPILLHFIDDHRLLVIGEWFEFLPNPATSGGALIDLDRKQAIAPPRQFADLTDITWAADGRHVLLHNADKVQLWQVDPWRPLSPLAPEMMINGARSWILDPQLHYAVQVGRNMGELRVFDPHHLDAPRTIPLPPHESFSAWATSKNGQLLAIGTSNGQIFLIDMRNRVARQLTGPLGSRATWLSFDEDGAWLAVACQDGSAVAYEVATGEKLYAGQIHADFTATRVDIDRQSRMLMLSGQIAGGANAAEIWHLPQQDPILGSAVHMLSSPPPGSRAGPYWLSAAPRAGLLASAGMDGEVRLWRLPRTSVLDARPPLLVADNLHFDGDHAVDVDDDQLRVASTAHDTATPWLKLPPPIVFASLTAGGKTLVAVARTGLHVLDAATLQPRIPTIALDDTPQNMAIDADGRLLALGFNHNGPAGFEERIALYDLADGKRLDRGDLAVAGPLRQFVFSPDASRLLVTGPGDGSVDVFATRTRERVCVFPQDPSQPVIWAAFTADSHKLWMVRRNIDDTQAENADLLLLDPAANKIVEERHIAGVFPIGIAAIGAKPLLAGRDRLVLDPGMADARTVSGLHNGEATTVFAVSHDQRLVAHAFGNGVQLYDTADLTPIGPPLPTRAGQMSNVSVLAFSDDDRHLLAMLDPAINTTWRVWNVASSAHGLDALHAEAAMLAPRDAGPRILRMADTRERERLRAGDPGPPKAPEARPVQRVQRWLGPDPIPARDAAATPMQIDLGAAYNRAPQSEINVMNSNIPALADMPFGLPRIDGVDYDWRGAIEMRQQGAGVPLGTHYQFVPISVLRGLHAPSVPIAALHVLVFAPETLGESHERAYAYVRLHYRDGSQARLPLRTQREVKGWSQFDRPTPVGWYQGDVNRILGLASQFIFNNPRLANPHPEKIIETIDLETIPNVWSTPVFFAITAEPVIAGANSGIDETGRESGTDSHARDGNLQPSTRGGKP